LIFPGKSGPYTHEPLSHQPLSGLQGSTIEKEFIVVKKFALALALASALAVPALAQTNTTAPATPGGHHGGGGGKGIPDHIRRLRHGIKRLDEAKHDLNAKAGEEYGGHRAKGEQLIEQAKAELKAAEEYWRTNEKGK
jgi:hypothetical protein